MNKWIFIFIVSLKVCLCANISPVALVNKASYSNENNKIVGGYDASLGEAPWQVGLFNDYQDGSFSLFCGGTLLSPLVVVTAAHCMDSSSTFSVRLGRLDRRDLPLRYSVKEVYMHENYNSIDNDIALLILEEAVNLEECVAPASLPLLEDNYYHYDYYENQTVLISGWGTVKSGNSDLPNNLQAASVQIFSQDICNKFYNFGITDNMICAGVDDYSKDSCQGDSGGPLVLKGESSSSSNILLGITSWGNGCALQGYPGVYTKVSNYVSWIEEKACSSNACINNTMLGDMTCSASNCTTSSNACINNTMLGDMTCSASDSTTSGYILIFMHVFLSLIWR